MIEEYKPFNFVVTHVEAEGQLLKIWAQTEEEVIQSVTMLLHNIQDQLGYNTSSIPQGTLPENTRCFARHTNNEFARARVINHRSDGMVKVLFIDYGSTAMVTLNNIRLSQALTEGSYLFSWRDGATPFVLANVLSVGGYWLEDVITNIRGILVNNQFRGSYFNFNNLKALKFAALGSNDFSQVLVSRNMAIPHPFCNQIKQNLVTISPMRPQQANNVVRENWREPVPQNTASVSKVIKTNAFFKAIQLEINSVHNVQVSYVEEGPWKFSIQLVETIPHLNAMMEKINSRPHLPLQEPPIAGAVCLGKQSKTNRLCRVVLNSPGDTSCKVYFADYGHHEILPFSSIYQIPEEFMVPSVFSIRFTLSGIMNWIVCQDIKDYFGGLVVNQNLQLRVCKGPMSPLTQYCDLFLQDENIRDKLCKNFPNQCTFSYLEPNPLQVGMVEVVFVSHVISPAKFFVQLEKYSNSLDEVMEYIEQISRSAEHIALAQMYANMPCIALYDVDQKWYRATVLNMINNNTAKVFYVDYGNEEVVSLHNLRAIPAKLVKMLPKQAIACSLHEFLSVPVDPELKRNFETLVLEERLSLKVLNVLPHTVVVNLFDSDNISDLSGRDIAEKLKDSSATINQTTPASDEHDRRQNMSFRPLQIKNDNDNWNSKRQKESVQGQSFKGNQAEVYETSKSKSYNQPKKSSNDYSSNSEDQNRRFDKEAPRFDKFNQNNDRCTAKNQEYQSGFVTNDYSRNERFNKGAMPRNNSHDANNFYSARSSKENQGNKFNTNVRPEINFGSDKMMNDRDSDTSSRSSGRRNSHGGRRNIDEQHKRTDKQSNNLTRIGRWENEDYDSSNKNSSDTSIGIVKSPKDDSSNFSKSDWDTSKVSTNDKEIARCVTSTPISKIPPPNITVGAVKNCEMVYYTDPSDFYVQLLPDNEELHIVMEKISSIYDNGGKTLQAHEVKVDLQCIAQYSADKQWYRAVVKSVESNTATVHFVDYGNVETISSNRIKEIEPEFLKLSAQAIHCKLFCPSKLNWNTEEIDILSDELYDKSLEAEFVTEDNGIYEVLIKLSSSDSIYVNERFSDGLNLNQEKESVRSKTRSAISSERILSPNFAPLNEKWLENKLSLGKKYNVLLAWFINPENFYCQLVDQQEQFRSMMTEIQKFYIKQTPISEPLNVGDSVIAVLPDDGVLYRAEVLELNKPRGHVVQYIDYGDRAMVDPHKMYPADKKFKTLPRQAIFCSLKNIAPVAEANWINSAEMNKIFVSDKFECVFHEIKNDRYLVSLTARNTDVASTLVEKNLAVFSSATANKLLNGSSDKCKNSITYEEITRIDINLLEGQTLLVKIVYVEGVGKFFAQFNTAENCQATIDSYMSESDPKVMPRLLSYEVCLGAGCLVNCKGKWRRSVVVVNKKPKYEVRLIDTGELETITLNSMVKLPGQLALMQNQAFECAMFDVPLSLKANDVLKTMVTGKDVKIFVEKIEGNKLMVRLFDINGKKIRVVDSQNTENISPLCNMQILSSTHDVIVTWINNANSVWLQRKSEAELEHKFLQTLYNHYSEVGNQKISVEEGQLYAALSNIDNNWYRVKVTNVEEKTATVILMDYGNIEEIALENFRQLESKFYLPHQLAIEVSLNVKLNGSDEAQREILEKFLLDKEFSATLFNVNRRWVADLSENGEKLSEKLASLDIVKEMTKTHFEFKELPEMTVGERYKVFVSHVDNPSELWIQRAENIDSLKELERQLEEASYLAQSLSGAPEEKSLCLAKHSLDNQWYRAEIIDADDEIVTMRFIDYGKTGVIDNNPDSIKQLSEKWKSIKKFAVQCKLDVLLPNYGDDWTDEPCTWTSKILTEQKRPLEVLIVADKSPIRVDLFLPDNQSVCKMLIEKGFAAPAQSSQQSEEHVAVVDEEEDEPLDPRSAYVSSIVSVDDFYVQEETLVTDLETMEDKLVMATVYEPLEKVEEGLVCVAQFSADNKYYRAVILSDSEKGTTVRYIDYGNVGVTKDLRKIPDDLALIRPLSRKCRLAKPDGVENWPASINDEFIKLADNGVTIFLLDVIEEGETCLVRLTHGSVDVAIKLLDLCARLHQFIDEGIVEDDTKTFTNTLIQKEERLSPLGQENAHTSPKALSGVCAVAHIISPSEFYIQDKSNFDLIEEIADKMENAADFNIVSEIKEGKILAAKFDADNLWYRSKVLSHGANGVEVLYIDYGNTAVTAPTDLRELPDDLIKIPALTTCCYLAAPENIESWSKSACEKFIALVDSGNTEFEFKILESTTNFENSVRMSLTYENQDVTEILLHENAKSLCKQSSNETCEQSKDLKDNNVSSDSAIHSEPDPLNSNIASFESLRIADQKIFTSSETIQNTKCSTEISETDETVIYVNCKQTSKSDELFQNQVLVENLTDYALSNNERKIIDCEEKLSRSMSVESKCSSKSNESKLSLLDGNIDLQKALSNEHKITDCIEKPMLLRSNSIESKCSSKSNESNYSLVVDKNIDSQIMTLSNELEIIDCIEKPMLLRSNSMESKCSSKSNQSNYSLVVDKNIDVQKALNIANENDFTKALNFASDSISTSSNFESKNESETSSNSS